MHELTMRKTPIWLLLILSAPATASPPTYKPDCYIRPCELTGDFDGDKKPDKATLIRRSQDGKKGILFRLSSRQKEIVVGAGNQFGNGGDNFDWMDHWSLQQANEKSPKAKGDSIWIGKSESASAEVFWDGKRLRWRQLGD
jgi:hypothetical protein